MDLEIGAAHGSSCSNNLASSYQLSPAPSYYSAELKAWLFIWRGFCCIHNPAFCGPLFPVPISEPDTTETGRE